MPLTDAQIRQIKPEAKDVWLTDEKGLRLLVKANGSKYWRLKYRFQGKQKTLALGVYPDVSLKSARLKMNEAKLLLADGKDPSEKKKVTLTEDISSSSDTFSSLCKEWWEHQRGTWTEDHANRVWSRLEDNTFKQIGGMDIRVIKPQDVISTVRKIEDRGALDVAQRVLQDIRRVCRYSVQLGKLDTNPAAELSDILKGRKTQHIASLPREELPAFLKALSKYEEYGRLLTKYAIQLLVLTFVRPGELRAAKWTEIDEKERIWRIPGERMKMGTDHIVPLADQALSLLRSISEITHQYDYLFPSERDRTQPMSDNTMRKAIFKLGYDGMTKGKSKANPHGFRATASSILNEQGFNPDAIERQLSHQERNGVRAAYIHHARYMDDRKKMMQWWADYVDQLLKKK
jgi:integrase